MTRDLIKEHKKKKSEIRERLDEFRAIWRQSDNRVFSELCFCICTPQSRAVYCDRAVSDLEKSGILFTGGKGRIRPFLKAVRFPNNKAGYIAAARKLFAASNKIRIKDRIDPDDIFGTRLWFVRNVKGIGLKEASHFLRNVGFGKDLAILDVHILKNLKAYGVIKEIPKSITKKEYLRIENKLRDFCDKIKIPMDELDLLFWSRETGFVFK